MRTAIPEIKCLSQVLTAKLCVGVGLGGQFHWLLNMCSPHPKPYPQHAQGCPFARTDLIVMGIS